MSSDSQLAANQANALKSTGPRTAQGKATARRNALKHGMTCQKENLFRNDAKLYKTRLESWAKTARPRTDMELYQLEGVVRATVNLDRCARNAQAEQDRRERQVFGHWEGVQTKKINRAIKHWTTQPGNCVAELETFARGVEWLLGQWDELAETLEANEFWTIDEAYLAMRLMGKCPEMFPGDGELAAFRMFVVATLPGFDADVLDEYLGIDTSQLEPEARSAAHKAKLPTREDALEGLWATYNAELDRLGPIQERLWETEDWPALSERIDLVSFDDSKTGVLRRRYESANHMDVHRCFKQLNELRRQRLVRVDDQIDVMERESKEL